MEAKQLQKVIKAKGLKQSWIADQMGVTKSLVSQWVRGSINVPEKHVKNLKRILG